jgi:AcrR family transcriptional regulator
MPRATILEPAAIQGLSCHALGAPIAGKSAKALQAVFKTTRAAAVAGSDSSVPMMMTVARSMDMPLCYATIFSYTREWGCMPRTGERGGPQTRAKIAEVAARMFLEHGYDAVTVAEVAREAGVSSVTVFNHFPRKEDLFLDRAVDADELLRQTVRERSPGVDVLSSLHGMTLRLLDGRHPLSGINGRSVPFFRTVAASPALVARAREIAADLQRALTEELLLDAKFEGDASLFSALFIAGYSTVLVETARRLTSGEPEVEVVDDHLARFERLFDALRNGLVTGP